MLALIEKRNNHLEKIYEGGGKKAIAKQKERNKLTARERIDYLIDKNSNFTEIGAFAGFEMYEEYTLEAWRYLVVFGIIIALLIAYFVWSWI